uniref:Uncharacterized protein n=1 Tax=Lactuca sativa TaxID=4236 RepID=A0A9R1UT33_LACSA|nr:hypothetical protein LSAT_V11C800454630 [Lactuca sativa]
MIKFSCFLYFFTNLQSQGQQMQMRNLHDHMPFFAWPVRTPRPVAFKLVADTPLLTGQQTIFLFFLDMIKGMFLAVVIGPPVVVAIILIVQVLFYL